MLPVRPPDDLDIVAVLIVATTAIFGRPRVAEIVAPYLVIVTCALAGAVYSATGRETESRWHTFGYILGVALAAIVVTVPASDLLARYSGMPARWIMGCVAGCIGIAGADLPRLLRAALRIGLREAIGNALRWASSLFPQNPQNRDPK